MVKKDDANKISTEENNIKIGVEEIENDQEDSSSKIEKNEESLKKEKAAKAYKNVEENVKTTSKKSEKKKKKTKKEPEEEKQKNDYEEKIKEEKDRYLRLQAEFSNYKKRVEKESLDLASYLKAEIIKEFLPVLDDFKHMIENVQKDHEDVNAVLQGIDMIFKKNLQFIEKFGIKKMACLETEFDPEFHEALITQPVENEKQDGTILQIYQDGYMLNEKVVRPAKVIVGKFEGEEDKN